MEENVRLSDSSIRFCGDDALIVLSQSKKHAYKIRIDAWQGTTVFLDLIITSMGRFMQLSQRGRT